tara:strand:+ start:591 stop:4664 length:4074 start_codon:yes stop_codon:yes gene_type:complete
MADKIFSKVPNISSGNFLDVYNDFYTAREAAGPNSNDAYVAEQVANKYNFNPQKFMKQLLENEKREDAFKDAVENKGLNPTAENAGKFSSTLVNDNSSLWEKYNPTTFIPKVITTAIGQGADRVGDLFVKLTDEAYPSLSDKSKDSLPAGQMIADTVSETYDKFNNFIQTNEYTKPIIDSAVGRAVTKTIDPVVPAGTKAAAEVANYVLVGSKIQKALPVVKAIPKLLKNVVGGVTSFIGADLLIGDKEKTFTPSLIPKWLEDNPTLGPIVTALAEQTTIKETDSNYQKLATKIKDSGATGIGFGIALRAAVNVAKGMRSLRNKGKAIDEKILEPEEILKNKNVKEIEVKKDKEGEFGWEINTVEPIALITDKKIAQPTSMFKRFFTSRQGLDSKSYRAFEQLEGAPKALAIDLTIQNKNFNKAIKNSYGQPIEKLDDPTIAIINKALGDAPVIEKDAPELIKKIFKKSKKKLTKNDKEVLTEYYDSVAKKGLVERDKALQLLPEPLRKEVIKMRINVDKYTDDILNTGIAGKSVSATLDRNKGLYITTDYKMFSNPKWVLDIKKNLEGKGAKGSEAYTAVMEAQLLLKQNLPKETSNKEIQNILYDYVDKIKPGTDGILDMLLLSKNSKMQQSKYSKILNNRKNIDEAFFKILGKENNPLVRYNNTIKNMSTIVGEHQFLSTIKSIANSKYGSKLFTTGSRELEKGFSGDLSELASNYIKAAGPEANPLANVFTTPLYKKYLTEGIELAKANPSYAPYYALNGLVNSNVTTLSATTHSKNFMGNLFFLAMNGNLGPSLFKNIKPLMENLLKSKGKDVDMMKFFAANGLTNSGVRAQTIVRSLDEAVNNPNSWYAKASKPLDYAATAYSLEDDVYKILSFYKEKARYKKALPNASESELNLLAVEVVKDTMPTYHKLIRPVKYLRRVPIGTFPAFTHEVFRTSVGTTRRGLIDLVTGVKTKNTGLIQAGMARLAGATTAATGAIAHIQYQRMRHNIDRDDIVAMDAVAQDWQKNDIVDYDSNIHINSKGELEVKVKNLTSVLPHAPIIQIAQQLYPYIMSKEGKDDLANGNLDNFDKIINAVQTATSVFTDESLLAAGIMDVYRGETKKGRSLYDLKDSLGERRLKDVGRILSPAFPGAGTIKTVMGVLDAKRSEEINDARREDSGLTDSGWNARYKDKFKSVPGVKFDAINISKSFQSAAASKAAAMSAANSNIIKSLNNSYNIDWSNEKEVAKVIKDFKNNIEYSFKQQQNLAELFNDFKKLKYYKGTKEDKVDDDFILKLLSDSGLKKENKKLHAALNQAGDNILNDNVGYFNSPSLKESFGRLSKNQNIPMEVLLELQNILTQAQGTILLELD